MPATRLAIAALRISWGPLLKAAPAILTAAGELVARLSDRKGQADHGKLPADAPAILTRLEALETSGVSQAELTKEMAGQLKEVTQALRVVALRVLFALAVSVVAIALALAALIRAFL